MKYSNFYKYFDFIGDEYLILEWKDIKLIWFMYEINE